MNIPKEKIYEVHGVTPPELLEQIVNELPDVPDIELEEYADVIVALHDQKNHSFRQIAEFLSKHGIETNRSAVYRVYKDKMERPPEADEPLRDDDTGEIVES